MKYTTVEEKNKQLEKIDKKFPILYEKLACVFRLYFDKEGLKIEECCDNWFYSNLSVKDLRQLSAYFNEVADFLDAQNKNRGKNGK